MDPEAYGAIAKNDEPSFIKLVEENDKILYQRTNGSLNSVLHLAAKYGHISLVREIIRFRPEMVTAENNKLETPLHKACHQGDVKIAVLLLNVCPWSSCKVDIRNRSPLFIACSNGHLELVKLLLRQPWFIGLEDDFSGLNPLHVAASNGHTDVVECLLSVCPHLAHEEDENGSLPLHTACRRGRASIISLLLRFDSNLAVQFDNNGHTPSHLAVLNDDPRILQEFVELAPTSFQICTRNHETVLHLAARFNKFNQHNYLVKIFRDTNLFCQPDRFGNTNLHIAIFRGHYRLAANIIHEAKTIINYQNSEGKTALDFLNQAEDTLQVQHLKDLIKSIGAKTGAELHPTTTTAFERPRGVLEDEFEQLHPNADKSEHSIVVDRIMDDDSSQVQDYNVPTPESTSDWSKNSLRRKHTRSKRKKEKNRYQTHPHTKLKDAYAEALQNARNTITIVAVLIATVTYTAGISPPGGVYQDGPLRGKSVAAKSTAFKVFTVSNNIALFTSLCIVIALVSIIPFKRKPLMRLLTVAHKVMWMAIAFMSTAYVAAAWVTMPYYDNVWTFAVLVSVCSGTLGSLFIFLGVMLGRHWLRKLKWREQAKEIKHESDRNSDQQSSIAFGYHTY